MKFRKRVEPSVIQEVQEKVKKLPLPQGISIRPVLIYDGKLHPFVSAEDFFNNIINMRDLLNG